MVIQIASLYDFLAQRRKALYAAVLVAILASAAAMGSLELREDIGTMLPEAPPEIAEEFRLLQHSPFANRMVINLRASSGTPLRELIGTADSLAGAMGPPYFDRVLTGPPRAPGEDPVSFITAAFPNLATDSDLLRVRHLIRRDTVRASLMDIRESLLSPVSGGSRALAVKDPLGLRFIVLEKLRYLSAIPRVGLRDNHFVSEDGKNVLIIAASPLKATDSRGSEALIRHFRALVEDIVPEGIEAAFISGHRYSAANAETARVDLFLVLLCSSVAILILFVLWLRTWSLFFVFLIPASVLCPSAVIVYFAYGTLSAITLGFGSVILGIAVDFAVHVYYAVRMGRGTTGASLSKVSRPVFLGGLTSICAFSILLFSDIPGQRQLALFSMTGLTLALILCLGVLPHMIGTGAAGMKVASHRPLIGSVRGGFWIIAVWMGLLSLCIWQAGSVRFDGDLRSQSFVPPDVRADEAEIKQTWGDMRGRALLFCQGRDMASALAKNYRLFQRLQKEIAGDMTTLAPVLPPPELQRTRQERWNAFWAGGRKERLERLIKDEGARLGFAEDAFAPFFEGLFSKQRPLTIKDFEKAGLGELAGSMLMFSDSRVSVISLVPDTDDVRELIAGAGLTNVRLVSGSRFGDMISRAMQHDFIRFIGFASLSVVLLLSFFFRDTRKVLCALIPVGTGLAFMAGMMGFLGIRFNLFNVVAAILVIGLGVDYGIFMIYRLSEGHDHATEQAVLVSGLTTLAGFGALVLARHPALHSIGLTVLLGIGAAIPSALLVIPSFYKRGSS